MRDWVSEWVQDGELYVWRYARARRHWNGWQFTADPEGCRSVRNLLDRMHGGSLRHRTLRLERVTAAIASVPNAGYPVSEHFDKLRLVYQPDAKTMAISPSEDMLTLTVNKEGAATLSSAFADIEVGGGDFGIIPPGDRRAPAWMFWWMPNINYHRGKRM